MVWPSLVPFSFRLNIERKTDCQQSNRIRFLSALLVKTEAYHLLVKIMGISAFLGPLSGIHTLFCDMILVFEINLSFWI